MPAHFNPNNEDLLDEDIPGSGLDETATDGEDPFFACEIGTNLWEKYRSTHPAAPKRPPECPEDCKDPAAREFFHHSGSCPDCNEYDPTLNRRNV